MQIHLIHLKTPLVEINVSSIILWIGTYTLRGCSLFRYIAPLSFSIPITLKAVVLNYVHFYN